MGNIYLNNGKTIFWDGKTFLTERTYTYSGRYLVSFGDDDNVTSGNWNNITETAITINGLIDNSGKTSDINLIPISGLTNFQYSYTTVPDMYPPSSLSTMKNSSDNSYYQLTGMDNSKLYDISFFSFNSYTNYTIDDTTVQLSGTTNENVVSILDVSPKNGIIFIEMSAITTWCSLGILDIVEKTSIEYSTNNIDSIQVVFASVPENVSVEKTSLLYDKQYALSYTWDDGMKDGYTYGFKYLNGGIAGDSQYYSGKTITDGCGNDVNFTVALAIFSANGYSSDIHTPTFTNNIQWSEVAEVYDAGWGINSHQYEDGAGGSTYQVDRNISYVRLQTSGYTTTTDNGATIKVFTQNSSNLMNDYIWQLTGITKQYMYVNMNNPLWFGEGVGEHQAGIVDWDYVDGNNRIGYDTFPVQDFNFMRSNGTSLTEVQTAVSRLTGATENNTYHSWKGLLSHSVAGGGGGFASFGDFKTTMDWLEDNYGSKGLDNMWISCDQTIYEYLYARDATDVNYTLNNNILDIRLSNQNTNSGNTLPDDMRTYALSLKISGATISDILINGGTGSTYNTNDGLINLNWVGNENQPTKYDFADYFVPIAEQTALTDDKEIAQDYVSAMFDGTDKAAFQVRLDAI
jgi:hypothetical protein